MVEELLSCVDVLCGIKYGAPKLDNKTKKSTKKKKKRRMEIGYQLSLQTFVLWRENERDERSGRRRGVE